MSPGSSSTPYGVRTFATSLIRRYRASSRTTASTPDYQHSRGETRLSKFGKHETKLKVQQSDDHPRANNFSWVKWVLGSMLPIIFSFWKQKWDSLLRLEGKVEEVVKEAEEVAEVVEKAASTTEKLSAEVAEKLENGKLKEVALRLEHVSNVIAKDARMTEDFIRKVGELKQDLTDLEAMIDKTKQKD